MSRKRQDPIVPVLDYFETQPIDSAKTALEVIIMIMVRRGGGKPTETKRKPTARRGTGPGTVASVGE